MFLRELTAVRQGPLIRDKLPIRTLMDEFNNADSTYITKIDVSHLIAKQIYEAENDRR